MFLGAERHVTTPWAPCARHRRPRLIHRDELLRASLAPDGHDHPPTRRELFHEVFRDARCGGADVYDVVGRGGGTRPPVADDEFHSAAVHERGFAVRAEISLELATSSGM